MTAMVRGMVVASSRMLGWTTVTPLGWVVQEARGEDTSTTRHTGSPGTGWGGT